MTERSNRSGSFSTLLSPLRVGQHTLRNRVIMGSMHTRLEHADNPVAREAAFYAERAAGGVALIVTGGFAPNEAGRLEPGAPILDGEVDLSGHGVITSAVHRHGAKILLQVLHTGRYARHDAIVGVSAIRSPINPRVPRVLTSDEIESTIDDYGRCAELAAKAGYDGVEIMGSEGYLLNQFAAPRTNIRTDAWGGDVERRHRCPTEVVRRVRQALGPAFLIMYRISAVDLVEDGSTGTEIDALARAVQGAGADILSTGIGWHESRVPTIAYTVPRAAFSYAPRRLKDAVSIPVVASNRINTPEVAEHILAAGEADLVSMARPMLADPEFVAKAAAGRSDEINTCIACNQACLDFIFDDKIATCLVNPRACRELDYGEPARGDRRVAVVGSGPAGLAIASTAASRGHSVTLFEAQRELGGQIHMARRIPGKSEFDELLRFFEGQVRREHVDIRLGVEATGDMLAHGEFDTIVVAAGIQPRKTDIPGSDHPMVLTYSDVLLGRAPVGERVAIIGTGGIGHDVAEFLTHEGPATQSIEAFFAEYGVDPEIGSRGGLVAPQPATAVRTVTMFQRRVSRPGDRLGVSTGWILRNRLRARGVKTLMGVTYSRIDDDGLHYLVDGEPRVLPVDNVVICIGQEPHDGLASELAERGLPVATIGGARHAGELDALRAIQEGMRLAYDL